MGARNRVGIGLSYRPARLHRLAEIYSLESILGLLKSKKIRALIGQCRNPIQHENWRKWKDYIKKKDNVFIF